MSTVKAVNYQIGQSLTASQNFTWYQPASPDGTVRLGNGNSGSVSDVITVGTTGNLTFANSVSLSAASTKTLTLNGGAGSNGLVLDASNNVGIGTSSPDATLVLNNATASQLSMKYNGSLLGWLYAGSAGFYVASTNFTGFSVGGNERMRLDASGNLGLGVTPSGWSPGVSKAVQLSTGSLYTYSTDRILFGQNVYINSSNVDTYIATAPATTYRQYNGTHAWFTAASGAAGNAISFTQAMTLDASGRLGVFGITSPTYPLSVGGPPKMTNSGFNFNSIDKDASSGTVTFTYAELGGGMDNLSALVIFHLYLATTNVPGKAAIWVGTRQAARGAGGTVTQISTTKDNVTTFTVAASSDNTVITCDSGANIRVRMTVIAGGGTSIPAY